MSVIIAAAFLPADDPEKSLGFFRDALGFEVRQDVGQGTMRWITVGPPDQPETGIVLHPPAADPGVSEEERRTIAVLMAKGVYTAISLASKDLQGTFDRAKAWVEKEGVAEVLQEPEDQPWGVRDCAFRDPAGNLVRINQR
ncbi:VOC family protein [Lentzea sp. PSKA42]|uniref:VOC family protein n=1 Tax=Lentzea indica TaxID=2604800 RepID=A0ABX1FKF5_9PSEU|nr:VOC family protein [Lentzea indica]NKE59474.1 VOC family protein [Lentzea indica]